MPRKTNIQRRKPNKTKLVKADVLDWTRKLAEETGYEMDEDDESTQELDRLNDQLRNIVWPESTPPATQQTLDDLYWAANDAILQEDVGGATAAMAKLDTAITAAHQEVEALDRLHDDLHGLNWSSDISPETEESLQDLFGEVDGHIAAGDLRAGTESMGKLKEALTKAAAEADKNARMRDPVAAKKMFGEREDEADRTIQDLREKLPPAFKPDALAKLLQGISAKARGGADETPRDLILAMEALNAQAVAIDKHWAKHGPGCARALASPLVQTSKPVVEAVAAAAAAVAVPKGADFEAAAETLAKLGDEAADAAQKWDAIRPKAEAAVKTGRATLGVLVKISEMIFDRSLPGKKCDALDDRLSKAGSTEILSQSWRDETGAQADAIEAWLADVKSAALDDAEVMRTLRDAYGLQKSNKETAQARLRLGGSLTEFKPNASGITAAYDALLNTPGPWRERQKQNAAGGVVSAFLLTLGYAQAAADSFGAALAGKDKKAADLLGRAGVTMATLNLLRGFYPTPAKLLEVIEAFPSEATLNQLAVNYLPYKDVTAANFHALVAGNQVFLQPSAGQANPFRYNCQNHGAEAEASLEVLWRQDVSGKLNWGLVHVHYHGRRHTTPNAQTYYHVKASSFSASAGEVTAGPAIVLIDAAIPAGVWI